MSELKNASVAARQALEVLNTSHTLRCNIIETIAELLLHRQEYILEQNARDISAAEQAQRPDAMVDRLRLTKQRIEALSSSLRSVAKLPDPLGKSIGHTHQNGMTITQTTVPIGVVAVIYESRPNVTADIAALAIKTGNGVILRGGSEAINTNIAIHGIIESALLQHGVDSSAVYLVKDTSRATADELLTLRGYIDLLIPRGGANLIQHVVTNSKVPVIETGAGICHVFIDRAADLEMALNILDNAKTHRPSVCNAAETLICHADIAKNFLPLAKQRLDKSGVAWYGCAESLKILGDITAATDKNFATEYNDLVLNCKVVDSLDEAIEHINFYGTFHSEAIVTKDPDAASEFCRRVDAAVVYVNASTRFTDGEEFGLGAEIGISTQKLPPRGPMGPQALTTIKYIVNGNGQIR